MTDSQLIAHLAQVVHAQNHGTRRKTFHGCDKELCRLAAEAVNASSSERAASLAVERGPVVAAGKE